jgi:signal transduction histidine kinase
MRIRVVLDALAVLVLAFGAGGNLAAGAWALPLWLPAWLGWTIMLTSVTPILLRRWWPRPAYVLALVLTAAAVPIGGPVLAIAVVAAGCALYTFVVRRGSRASRVGFVAGLLGIGLLGVVVPNPSTATTVNFGASALIVGFALGIAVHGRREYAAAERETHAREAVSAERLRIAREMHDVVAHSMSLIAVKAAVGNHVALEQPAEAREALRVIEDTSRETLAELRRMLGVLRDGTGVPALAPAPTLADLRALAERAEQAGALDVDLAVDGLDELPGGVGQSVYRIVQEALTNVVKHAGATTCRIHVTGGEGEVGIEVRDDGRGGTATPGHGLIGMRERVAVYGGEFSAEPAGIGFRVFARLPYETAAAR